MPKAFDGLTANFHPALYLPLYFADRIYKKGFLEDPGHFALYVLGRLRPGRTIADANDEVTDLEPGIRRDADPTGIYLNQFFKNFRLRARDGRSGISWVKEVYSRPLLVLEILVAFLLVLTCLNTGLVMLARVCGRQQEYAIRIALGAGRNRLIAQILIETVLLMAPGLALGVLIGWGSARSLSAMLGTVGGASSMDVHPNSIILGFNVCIAIVISLGVGLWPALRSTRTQPALNLKASDRSVAAHKVGGWVVTLQFAVSTSLLVAALLLGGTLVRLLIDDPGLDANGTAVVSIDLARADSAAAERIVADMLRRAQQRPGTLAAGFTDTEPLSGFWGASRLFAMDHHGNVHSDSTVLSRWVSPGYFDAIGTKLVRGSSTAQLAPGGMAQCVISKNLAASVFPREDAIGRVIHASTAGEPDGANLDPKTSCLVVGVAKNARLVSLRQSAPHLVYNVISPLLRNDEDRGLFARFGIHLIVRAKSESLAIAALQATVEGTIPRAEQIRYQTFRQLEENDLNRERMLVSVSGSLAILAVLLTALGTYGLLMRSVALRTREIGIRISLGAQRSRVVLAISRGTLLSMFRGLVLGEAIAFALIRGIRRLLDAPASATGSSYLWSGAILITVSIIAFLFPIRRIISVDPVEALRAE